MPYCTSPYAAKARGNAIKTLVLEHRPKQEVAKQAGVHRVTLWRWRKKWEEQNKYAQLTNANRPHRQVGTVFRWDKIKWEIPTLSSAPHTHPNRLDTATIQRILALREAYGRCAEVIWHMLRQEGIN